MEQKFNTPKFDLNEVVFFVKDGIFIKTIVSAIFVSRFDISYALNGIADKVNECYLCRDISILDDKKDSLLKEAILRYPKGTRIKGVASSFVDGKYNGGDVYTVIGRHEVRDYEDVVALMEEDDYNLIYIRKDGKWEDIVGK